MTKDIETISQLVERNMDGMVLNVVLDYGSDYVIGVDKKDRKEDDFVMDPYYKVAKKTFKLGCFSPLTDLEKFKMAMKNPVYVRGK